MKLQELTITDLCALSHYYADKINQLTDALNEIKMISSLANMVPSIDVRRKARTAKNITERGLAESNSRWKEIGDELHKRNQSIEWSKVESFDCTLDRDIKKAAEEEEEQDTDRRGQRSAFEGGRPFTR